MVKAVMVLALLLGGCGATVRVSGGYASDPSSRHGWTAPRMPILGHPQRPWDENERVRVMWRF